MKWIKEKKVLMGLQEMGRYVIYYISILHWIIIVTYLQQLIKDEHFASGDIAARLQLLSDEHRKMLETWEERQHLFLQCKELQVLYYMIHVCHKETN